MSIRVVVADDQGVIRDGFAALLDAQEGMSVVGTAADGVELVELVERTHPDVALVDIRMPRMDGIAATAKITAAGGTRVLILTTFDLDAYVYDALRAGASGFLLKDVTAARLVEGVRIVAEGAMLLGPAASQRLIGELASAAATPAGPDPTSDLSPREREVLLQLGAGRSNAEIAAELVIGIETVKSHVAEVMRKLQLRDRIQAVVFCYQQGLL